MAEEVETMVVAVGFQERRLIWEIADSKKYES